MLLYTRSSKNPVLRFDIEPGTRIMSMIANILFFCWTLAARTTRYTTGSHGTSRSCSSAWLGRKDCVKSNRHDYGANVAESSDYIAAR